MQNHDTTHNGNGNGYPNGNGNGHNKGIFDLAPKQDPLLAQIVPAARRKVCLMTRITEAARMFFCYLTDCSLLPGVNSRKGVVKFSDNDLAMRFKVNPKTIRNWKRALEATGEVWLTEKFMKNTFPQTVYNITAIVGQATLPFNADSEDGSLVEDEVFSSNRRRRLTTQRAANGKFSPRVTPPGVRPLPARTETLQISEEPQPSEKNLPPTTAIDCRPPRQMVAAHHGNGLPTPTAMDCRPARQNFAAHDGNGLPPSPANGFRGPRQTVADNGKTKGRGTRLPETLGGSRTPQDEAFEEWIKGVRKMFRAELLALKSDLNGYLRAARSDKARAEWKRRLSAVEERLTGPAVLDEPLVPKKPQAPRKPDRPHTEAELLESAQYLVSIKKENLLTPAQKQVLAKHEASTK